MQDRGRSSDEQRQWDLPKEKFYQRFVASRFTIVLLIITVVFALGFFLGVITSSGF